MGKRIAVGLDIGTSSVKLVELEKNQSIRVNHFATLPLKNGVLNNGVVTDIAEVGRTIRELMQMMRIKQKKAVVAIAGQSVIVRHIKMPMMTRDELENAIRWEAERYIPFSIDEVTMDFQIIQEDEKLDEIEVMLVCAHNDIVYSHLKALDDAGVQPLAMDIQPFALMRTMGIEQGKIEGSVALLDIGAGTTDLTIVKDGVPRFTRIIPVAGSDMTSNISTQCNLEFKEAEKAKIEYGDALFDYDHPDNDHLIAAVNYSLQGSLKELAVELRRSFDYYRLQQRNEDIKELIISGGGSKIKNLIPFLRQELEMIVRCSSYEGDIECSEKKRSEFSEMYPIYTVALGLALREVVEV